MLFVLKVGTAMRPLITASWTLVKMMAIVPVRTAPIIANAHPVTQVNNPVQPVIFE